MPSYDVATRTRGPAINPTAGVTLRAVDALVIADTFTRDQVAYLMALAYESGRTAAFREDLAEVQVVWDASAQPRPTHEEAVTRRAASLPGHGIPVTMRGGQQSPLAVCDWPPVAEPGQVGRTELERLRSGLAPTLVRSAS